MSLRVEEYVREDGSNPFKAWFGGLDPQAAAKVTVALARLSLGNTSNVKWFAGIGECVINWGPGYRLYLAKEAGGLILLFTGGTKQRQHADVERARSLHAEYKARKAAAKTKAAPSSTPRRVTTR
jgi:putative addiction module killer protein